MEIAQIFLFTFYRYSS